MAKEVLQVQEKFHQMKLGSTQLSKVILKW